MKKTPILLALALLAAACNKPGTAEPAIENAEQTGTIHLQIISEDQQLSKAVTPYSQSNNYEVAVTKIQIFVFNADGKISNYYVNQPYETPALSQTISTTPGQKTVWVVLNGPDLKNVATESELKASNIQLTDNRAQTASGFVMTGSGTCNVTGSQSVPCSVSVSRLLSRVVLSKVHNRLPSALGDITLEHIFLCNVVGNQNVAGNAAPTLWYNKDGRCDTEPRNIDHIIYGTSSTYQASCPELTFKAINGPAPSGASYGVRQFLYAYPNSSLVAPQGFTDPFTAKSTVLTVVATIQGTRYYYPVVLNKQPLERNHSYTVELAITGPGSNDPEKPADRGSVTVNVTIEDWDATVTYEEVI